LRIAIIHVEVYNIIYNITSDFTDFEYVLVDTEQAPRHTLTPGQYSVSDVADAIHCRARLRLSFTYTSNIYLFTMEVDDTATYAFYLTTDTATWAEGFPYTAVRSARDTYPNILAPPLPPPENATCTTPSL
jgi:hypothetical protein